MRQISYAITSRSLPDAPLAAVGVGRKRVEREGRISFKAESPSLIFQNQTTNLYLKIKNSNPKGKKKNKPKPKHREECLIYLASLERMTFYV